MCLQRKKIYTNAHRLFQNRYSAYELSIPCGECTECRRDRANEWRIRTYYEYLDCISKGGFAIWDRLSYDNEHLPHLAGLERGVPDNLDFTCFNDQDITNFMKRLRSNLTYEKFKPKKSIRYLIAAEYGQEEGDYIDDKGHHRQYTLRPHYHVIMYCTDKKLTPAKLSMHIKKAWGKGQTNGIEDNPTYFGSKGIIHDKADAITISDYIGKYCLKSQDYDKVAKFKTQELIRWYIAQERGKAYDEIPDKALKLKPNRERIQKLLRRVGTFHRQSQNYGATALNDKKATKREGLLGMPDKKKIWWYQKLPLYFLRKEYQNYMRTPEGKVIWYWNEKGMNWKIHTMQKTIEATAKKFECLESQVQDVNFADIMHNYYCNNGMNRNKMEEWRKLNDLLFAYRNGRDWKKYTEYIMFHKGRIWDGEHNPEPWQTLLMNFNTGKIAEDTKEKLYYNYNHTTDKDHFGKRMIGHEDLGDKWKGYKDPHGDEITPQQFASLYCITEKCSKKWEDFDKLGDILDQINTYLEWNENAHERIKRQTQLTWEGQKKTLYKNII